MGIGHSRSARTPSGPSSLGRLRSSWQLTWLLEVSTLATSPTSSSMTCPIALTTTSTVLGVQDVPGTPVWPQPSSTRRTRGWWASCLSSCARTTKRSPHGWRAWCSMSTPPTAAAVVVVRDEEEEVASPSAAATTVATAAVVEAAAAEAAQAPPPASTQQPPNLQTASSALGLRTWRTAVGTVGTTVPAVESGEYGQTPPGCSFGFHPQLRRPTATGLRCMLADGPGRWTTSSQP
mmetsp:Transcript_116414/g.202457  ORF Transcript_116414/g.202457 Transcript_116414/m.202457 type:complete len:235 (+) Transcript_116414:1320-2024(+)